MAGQQLEVTGDVTQENNSISTNLNNAVLRQWEQEAKYPDFKTTELKLEDGLSFDNPYNKDDIIEVGQKPGSEAQQESGLDKLAQADTTAGEDRGPLGWMVDNPDSPTKHIPDLIQIDEAWKGPYNAITKLGAHGLLRGLESAKESLPFEVSQVPDAERDKVIEAVDRNLDPNAPISEADRTILSKYPGVGKVVNRIRDIAKDPRFNQAFALMLHVQDNLGPAIDMRRAGAKGMADRMAPGMKFIDGRTISSASLALITEAKALERYGYGGTR